MHVEYLEEKHGSHVHDLVCIWTNIMNLGLVITGIKLGDCMTPFPHISILFSNYAYIFCMYI